MFYPIQFDIENNGTIIEPYIVDIIASKLRTILSIENFIITVLCVFHSYGINKFPQLKEFVNDFFDLLTSLTEKSEFEGNCYGSRINVSEIKNHIRIDQVTWWSDGKSFEFANKWEARWGYLKSPYREIVCSDSTRRNYICGAFDAMFALWEAPGHCLLHIGKDPSDKGPKDHPHVGAKPWNGRAAI